MVPAAGPCCFRALAAALLLALAALSLPIPSHASVAVLGPTSGAPGAAGLSHPRAAATAADLAADSRELREARETAAGGVAAPARSHHSLRAGDASHKLATWRDEAGRLSLQSVPRGAGAATDGLPGGRQPRRALLTGPEPAPPPPPPAPPPPQPPKECWKYSTANFTDNELIDWVPQPDRYLLAVCHDGQLNNQLKCMLHFFTAAALLNRTLVIPPHSFSHGDLFGWPWELALDIPSAQRCLGPDAVISLADLRARLGGGGSNADVAIDAVVCFSDRFCAPREQWNVADLRLALPPGEPRNLNRSSFSPAALRRALEPEAGARVLALEDLFRQTFEMVHRGQYPLRSRCGGGNYLVAHPAITGAAQGFAEAVLGGRDGFLAVHLRRGDFYKFQRLPMVDRLWPTIPQVARLLLKQGKRRHISRVFLASNAHLEEVRFLEKLLEAVKSGSEMKLFFLPRLVDLPKEVTHPWAKPWLDLRLDDNDHATAILEKLVCTHASLFIGSWGSTFSQDAIRIRRVDQRIGCEDGDIEELEHWVRQPPKSSS